MRGISGLFFRFQKILDRILVSLIDSGDVLDQGCVTILSHIIINSQAQNHALCSVFFACLYMVASPKDQRCSTPKKAAELPPPVRPKQKLFVKWMSMGPASFWTGAFSVRCLRMAPRGQRVEKGGPQAGPGMLWD